MAKPRTPQVPGQIPQQDRVFREFDGVNTQAARQAIRETQWSQCENVIPIGYGNAKVVPAQSAVLATLTGETAYYMKSFNISNTPYMFFATASGALYQVNLNTNAKTTIIAAGTYSASGVQIAQWKNERILIIDVVGGGGYRDWDGTTLTSLGGVSSAPTGGTAIATYAGRVWISLNRTLNYSKAAAYNDFTGSGGNTIISDEVLTSGIQQLFAANNFLYMFGVDSINVIADVQVVGGVTSFSNTNISSNSGTNLPTTIFPFYRAIWYMNPSGMYALYGATSRKASDDMDGIVQLIDFTASVTGGSVQIYNILCAVFLFSYKDPAGTRPLLALYFNKKWYTASQGSALTICATANVAGVDQLYATDGAKVYQLFSSTTAAISSTLKTALWDMGEMTHTKQSLKLGVEVNVSPGTGTVTATVDSEVQSVSPSTAFSGSFAFTWTNNAAAAFTWTNNAAVTFVWQSAGYVWFQGDVEITGHYLGVTLISSTPAIQYSGIQLQHRNLASNWGS